MLYNRLLKTTLYAIVIIPALYSFRLHTSDFGDTINFGDTIFTISIENGKHCEVRYSQDIREHRNSILKQLSIASIEQPRTGFTREYLKDLNHSHFFPLRYKLTNFLRKDNFNNLFREELSDLAQDPIICEISNALSSLSIKNNNSHQQYEALKKIKKLNKLSILDDSALTKINEAAKIITAARRQLPGCYDAHTYKQKLDLIDSNFDVIKKNLQTQVDIIIEDMLFNKLYFAGQEKNQAIITTEVLNPILEKIDTTFLDKKHLVASIFSQSKYSLEKEFKDIVSPHYNNPMLIPGLDCLTICLTEYEQ